MKSIKEFGTLSKTVIDNNVEDFMKDYELETLNEDYGEDLEEAIANQFHVEVQEDSFEFIEEAGVYDLSDDLDIKNRIKRELQWLNDGSSSLEDLTTLEKESIAYFKNPTKVSYPVEVKDTVEHITGYIQFNAGVKFTTEGKAEIIWKSYGQKLTVDTGILLKPKKIIEYVESFGIEFNPEVVRVSFYGLPLERFTGCRIYNKGERKELVALSSDYSNIVLAIPCMADCSRADRSIYEVINEAINEEVLYGGDAGFDRVALGHWELTRIRLEEIKLEEREEKESRRIQRLLSKSIAKRNEYDENFREARKVVAGLNSGTCRISDLLVKNAKLLAQIVYLAEKKNERINNSAIYFQLKALSMKKRQEESMHLLDDDKSLEIINNINSSNHVDIHLLDLPELEGIFSILWSGIGVRISKDQKDKYFKLKERYQHLLSLNKLAA